MTVVLFNSMHKWSIVLSRHFEGAARFCAGGTATEKSQKVILSEISPVVEMTESTIDYGDFSYRRNDGEY